MTPEQFREHGQDALDWIAGYLAGIREYPVLSRVDPGELTERLPAQGPETGEPMEDILADFRDDIVPALTHWNHPRFLAYFSTSSPPPAILAEMLAAAVNANAMLWKSSPAGTELEQVTLGWLRQWMGLPDEFFGLIHDTASISSLVAIAAARQTIAPETRELGCDGRLTVYCSEFAHSSIDKAVITLGLGHANLRKIPVDAEFRLCPDDLERLIAADRAAGKRPCCIVATAGTTAVASVDPLPEIAAIARREGLWLHVDAAYGGAVAVVESRRPVLAGLALADSIVVNPHKWLFTPSDCSVLYTRHPDALRSAFSLVPEYLRTAPDPRALNLMDYGLQLGRRFRALKLWFVMRHYGRQGIAALIDNHCAMAAEFAAWVEADPRFELCAPVLFALVCFRWRSPDAENERLLGELNASGFAFLSHTKLDGRFVLRLAIGNYRTSRDDLRQVWDRIVALTESASSLP